MLLIGLFTPVVVMGGKEVMEAAAEGTNGGERCPDGGEDTDELSGLRESLLSPMMVAGGGAQPGCYTPERWVSNSPLSNSRPRTEARAGVVFGKTKNEPEIPTQKERLGSGNKPWHVTRLCTR